MNLKYFCTQDFVKIIIKKCSYSCMILFAYVYVMSCLERFALTCKIFYPDKSSKVDTGV